MDRPIEGSPPEQPQGLPCATDAASISHATSGDHDSALEPANNANPTAPSDSGGRWRRPLERIDAHQLDPTRTVIFRRIDPQTAAGKLPHFDTFDEAVDPDATIRGRRATDNGAGESAVNADDLPPEPARLRSHHHRQRRNDSVRQSLMMLVTIGVMLAAARFVLPGIVEEIRYAQHRGQLRAEFEVAGEGLKNVSLDTLSQAYEMVNAAAGPSVVHIDIHRSGDESIRHPDLPGAPSILISDQGSGVVVDAEGYILTNRHVVASSDSITVTLSDGRTVDSVVVGTDEMTDLAVLKVDADGLIPIPWGDSEKIRVGSPVWAIGSPFGLDRTVTFGILSGKHRVVRAKDRYQDFMQSDVAVNPGNSGGPLVDSRGTLIGINTAIVGDTYQGVSFSIPSGIAKKIYQQLREKGSIERGWLGVSLAEVPDDRLPGTDHRMRGAMISALADRSSGAARAGLEPGDLVVGLDDEQVRNVDHLMQMIGNAMAGTEIRLSVIRNDQPLEFNVLLGLRPEALFRRD